MTSMALATAPQLRQILNDIVDSDQKSFILPCGSAAAATGLRARLNKIRQMDRASLVRTYQEAGEFINPDPGVSPFDHLTFRVDGPNVLVDKAHATIDELRALMHLAPAPTVVEPPRSGSSDGITFSKDESIF